MASAIVRRMDTSTQQYAKNIVISLAAFLPAIAVALWAGQLAGSQCLLAVLAALGLGLGAFCLVRRKDDLVHDFFMPVILFAALGGMTWAVRGSSGFGAVKGCVFAGVMWGAAWWFIARNPGGPQTRRYASGWIILALTVGIGLSGSRGWMQWPSFFEGVMLTDAGKGESVPITPIYGFVWLFIAGMPWAGIGACLLAWCAAEKPLAAWQWSVRLFCGFGGAFFAMWLYHQYPQWFLPLYSTMKDRYADVEANPNLKRLMNDNGSAIRHMGFFLGFLLYELGRRDWKNVTLISTVGILNGLGWALCQNWKWAARIWPDAQFNFWRCWESSGGISIGIALGVAYYLVNRRPTPCNCCCAPATGRKGFPIFGVLSMIFMSVVLFWYVAVNASELFSAEWMKHAPFCAVLVYGLGLYFWHLRTTLIGAPTEEPAIPRLSVWATRFGLVVLVSWFLMVLVEIDRSPDAAAPWWTRYDYLLVAATAGYGVLYFLTALWKTVTARPSEESAIVPFFQRYPNLDWLVVFLWLSVIGCSYFRGELPAWRGWFWIAQESPIAWTQYLSLACLAFFGLVWCALSYLSPRKDGAGMERFAVHLGLLLGLGMSLKNGSRGWANIYLGDEKYWGEVYWRYIGPAMVIVLAGIILLAIARRVLSHADDNGVPYAGALIVLVLAHQNIIAHFITGPPTSWNEVVFNIYYVLLFLITAAIFYHYHFMQALVPFLPVAAAEGCVTTKPLDQVIVPAQETTELPFEGSLEPEAVADSTAETPLANETEEMDHLSDKVDEISLETTTDDLSVQDDAPEAPLETVESVEAIESSDPERSHELGEMAEQSEVADSVDEVSGEDSTAPAHEEENVESFDQDGEDHRPA